jgi:hypothetical protein
MKLIVVGLLTAVTSLSAMAGSIQPEQSLSENINTAMIEEGLKTTKLQFSCGADDATLALEVTQMSQQKVIYDMSKNGKLELLKETSRNAKKCENEAQIPIGEYCVLPICLVKESVPMINQKNLNLTQRNTILDTIN